MTSFIKYVVEFIDNNGVFKTLKTALVMVMLSFSACVCGYFVYLANNPSIIYDNYCEYIEYKHSQSFKYRMETTPKVQSILNDMVMETNAMRGFVVELHNGKYNSAGLSFNYGSMTYESLRADAESVMEDYADFSLERFPIILKAYNNGQWCGRIEELSRFDKRIALRLESNNVKYLYLKTIYGINDVIGFIGITYGNEDDNVDADEVGAILNKYASRISPLLDGEKANKK